jgi:hypothetical protein
MKKASSDPKLVKKIFDHAEHVNELISKAGDSIQMGLLPIKQGKHAVAFTEGSSGVTFTSKVQKNSKGLEVIQISGDKQSIAYAQIFKENKIVKMEEMKNSNLKNILEKTGKLAAIGADEKIYNNKNK